VILATLVAVGVLVAVGTINLFQAVDHQQLWSVSRIQGMVMMWHCNIQLTVLQDRLLCSATCVPGYTPTGAPMQALRPAGCCPCSTGAPPLLPFWVSTTSRR